MYNMCIVQCKMVICLLNLYLYYMCTVYMYTVSVLYICILSLYCVYVYCTCTLYMCTVPVLCISALYLYCVYVYCTCTVYVHCTCTVYMSTVPVLCICIARVCAVFFLFSYNQTILILLNNLYSNQFNQTILILLNNSLIDKTLLTFSNLFWKHRSAVSPASTLHYATTKNNEVEKVKKFVLM